MDPISSAMEGIGSGVGGVDKIRDAHKGSEASGAGSFSDALAGALGDVQSLQSKADEAIQRVATGEVQDVHQAIIAFEHARLSMQMLVEVRNKLVEAYQEVSRMPL